jgi:protein tyrosine/serine phosphatase
MTQTAPSDRVLPWEGCFNVRDLGGLPTADGRRTRWGALVRGDTLCRLTPAGQDELVRHGVRTVIDLRFPPELARDPVPHPFRDGRDGVAYVSAPLNAGQTPENTAEFYARYPTAQTRAELNVLDVDVNPVGIARVCATVADAAPGGVLLHCHAGKDRTGIVVAVLLALVGVADDLIAADYALSAWNLPGLTQEWLDSITQDPAERARLMRQAEPSPEAIQAVLDQLRTRYDGVEAYLRWGGLSDDEIAALRDRLLD